MNYLLESLRLLYKLTDTSFITFSGLIILRKRWGGNVKNFWIIDISFIIISVQNYIFFNSIKFETKKKP